MSDIKIFCVDDNIPNLLLLKKFLSPNYQVVTCEIAANAVATLCEVQPDLVLLDVNMPEVDGYQVCREIRKLDAFKHVPVIFLTARSGLQDRLNGYACGGDAYLAKPFDLGELNYVIELMLERIKVVKASEEASNAQNLAWMMMQNNSEIGVVLQYAAALSKVKTADELLQHTFGALSQFGLHSFVVLNLAAGCVQVRSDNVSITPIESELAELLSNHHHDRILHIGNRYVFNGQHCCFFIKDMPLDDAELTGRLKDHLALMLDSCDACIELMNYHFNESCTSSDAAVSAKNTAVDEISKMAALFDNYQQQTTAAFDQLISNIEESFFHLGLTEEQEHELLQYLEIAKNDINGFADAGHEFQTAIDKVALSIGQLINEKR
ncbi:response regulator [Catenovulum sp. SX2]|uniref:response regulator n=1 Tax=Catenovulum sp. SX2 TaxID=3398614 RepID=UPI003F828A3F